MPAPALRVVKMRGHSFAPRSVRNSRSLVHFHSAGAACAAFLFARQFVQHPANNAGCLFLCLTDLGSVEPPPSLRAFLPRDGKTQTRPARQSELCRLSYAWLFLLPHKKIKDFLAGTLLHLPKCGIYATFLLKVCFSHQHNRADNGTNRTSLVLPHRKHFRWGPRSGEEGDSPRTMSVSV